MSQILHIARKDARHLRWALAGWTALVAARVVLDTNRAAMELSDPMSAIVAAQLVSLMSFVELVATGLIVSLLVHEDPAVGRDAFWLTRPIDPRSLAWGKLALGLTTLVVVPLVGDLATLALMHAETGEMLRAVPSILLVRVSAVLPLFLAATLTPSLARFALLIVAVAGAFVMFVAILTTAVLMFVDIRETSFAPGIINPAPGTVASLVTIAASLAVILFQYRYRRLKPAVMLAAVGLLAAVGTPFLWRSTPAFPDPGAWARDETRTAAVVDADPPHVGEHMGFQRRDRATKQVAAHVRLAGLPADFSVQRTDVRSRFDVGGATLTSTASEMASVRRDAGDAAAPDSGPMQAALGVNRIWGRMGGPYEMWPVVLTINNQQFAQFAHTPGRLTADVDFHMQRYVGGAAAPVRPGQFFKEDRRRAQIISVESRPDSCTVFFREIAIPALFARSTYQQEEIVLRNQARREAVRGDQNWIGTGQPTPMSMLLGMTLGGFSGRDGSSGHGFAIREYSIRYPSRGDLGVPVDPAWLAGAEVVRVTADYAGRVTRSFTIDNFQIAR
jgi:hypothetical protein